MLLPGGEADRVGSDAAPEDGWRARARTEVQRVVACAAGHAGLRGVVDGEGVVAEAPDDDFEACLAQVKGEVFVVDIDADVAAGAAFDDGILPAEEDEIVAGPTEYLIRIVASVDCIVAVIAIERVFTLTARQVVVITAAEDFVIAAPAVQGVASVHAGKCVVAVAGSK